MHFKIVVIFKQLLTIMMEINLSEHLQYLVQIFNGAGSSVVGDKSAYCYAANTNFSTHVEGYGYTVLDISALLASVGRKNKTIGFNLIR
jgi:hypothetical protein